MSTSYTCPSCPNTATTHIPTVGYPQCSAKVHTEPQLMVPDKGQRPQLANPGSRMPTEIQMVDTSEEPVTEVVRACEWVSWFVNGKACHFSVESKAGQQVLERLGALGSGVVCLAPQAGSNEVCGKVIAGRSDKKFCSKVCAERARRSDQDARRASKCNGSEGGLHYQAQLPLAVTFDSHLPGVSQHASTGTVLPTEAFA